MRVRDTVELSAQACDAAGQLSSLQHSTTAGVAQGYAITRDSRGNPTQVDTTTAAGTTSALYTYDAVSRLRAECYPVTGEVCVAKSPRNAYTYDLVGNRATETARTLVGTKGTTVVTDYTYDAAYQLLTESVAGTATVTNTWTANGALATSTTPAGAQTYTTDLTDELISLELADGSTVGYTHDAQGNRTSRTVDGLLDASWAWDDLSSLPMRIGEYDATGTLATAWLADPTSSTGASLAQTSSGVSSWLLNDPFANTVASVSTTGNTVSGTRTMDAFGVQRSTATGSLANAAVGFAGQYLDDATGLYDMRARDYDPSSGRFNATDPVAVPTGMPYVAGYSYSYNNPLMFSDASGLTACGPIGSDCNGANLVPEFQRLDRALNDTAFLNLYHSLTEEQMSEIGFDDMSMIHSEAMDRQMHQMACEASPGECWAPCPEQDYDRCQAERGVLGFVVYFAAPMVLGVGASALLERACAADALAGAGARTTPAPGASTLSQRLRGILLDETGSIGSWSKSARVKQAGLPNKGLIRYVPPSNYRPAMPLDRGPSNGYVDRFQNEWVKGPSRTPGQPFEWDVQLSDRGRASIGQFSRDGKHVNVSVDGRVTH